MALEAVRNVDRVGTICKLFNPPFVLHTLFLALWLQRADVKVLNVLQCRQSPFIEILSFRANACLNSW